MFFSIFNFFYSRYTTSYSKVAFLLKRNIRPKIRCLGPHHWLNPGVITHSGRCGISSLCFCLLLMSNSLGKDSNCTQKLVLTQRVSWLFYAHTHISKTARG